MLNGKNCENDAKNQKITTILNEENQKKQDTECKMQKCQKKKKLEYRVLTNLILINEENLKTQKCRKP